MGCQVAHGDSEFAGRADRGLPEQVGHVQRWAVDREHLPHPEEPVVVDVELLATGEGVERLLALDVDRERAVAASTRLRTGPLR